MSALSRLINSKRNSLFNNNNKRDRLSASTSDADFPSTAARSSRVSLLRQSVSLKNVADTFKRLVDPNPARQSKLCEDLTESILCHDRDAETDPPLSEPPAHKTKIRKRRKSKGKRKATPNTTLVGDSSASIAPSSSTSRGASFANRSSIKDISHTAVNQTTGVNQSVLADQTPRTPRTPRTPPRQRRNANRHIAWNRPGADIAYGWPKGVPHASAARLPSWYQTPQPRFEPTSSGEAEGEAGPTASEYRAFNANMVTEKELRKSQCMRGLMQRSDSKIRAARLREFMQHPKKTLAEQEAARKALLDEQYRLEQWDKDWKEADRRRNELMRSKEVASSASATSANELLVIKASRSIKRARRLGFSQQNLQLSSKVQPSTTRSISVGQALDGHPSDPFGRPEHRLFQSRMRDAEARKRKGELNSPNFPEVIPQPMAPTEQPLRDDKKYARVADWSMSVSSETSSQIAAAFDASVHAFTGPIIKYWSLQNRRYEYRTAEETSGQTTSLAFPLTEEEQMQRDAIFARYSAAGRSQDGSQHSSRYSVLDELAGRPQELSDSLRKMPGAFLVNVDGASEDAANPLERSLEPDGSKFIGMGDYIWRTSVTGKNAMDPEQPCTPLKKKHTGQLDMPRSPTSVCGIAKQGKASASGKELPQVSNNDSAEGPVSPLAMRGPTARELVLGNRIHEASPSTRWLLAESQPAKHAAMSVAMEASSSNETRNTGAASSGLLASLPLTALTSATNSLVNLPKGLVDAKDLGQRLRQVSDDILLQQTAAVRARSGSIPGEALNRIKEKVSQRQLNRPKTAPGERMLTQPKAKVFDMSDPSGESGPVDMNDPCFRPIVGMKACSTCGRHYFKKQETLYISGLGHRVCTETLSHSHNQWPRQGRDRPPDVRSMTMAVDQEGHRGVNPAFILATHASTCYVMQDDYRNQGLYAFLPALPGDKYPFSYTLFSRSPTVRAFNIPGTRSDPRIEEVGLDIKKTGTFCAEVVMHGSESYRWRLYYKVEAPRGSYRQDRTLSFLMLVCSPELLRTSRSSRSSISQLVRKRASLKISRALQWVATHNTKLQLHTVALDTVMLVEVAKMLFEGVHPDYMDVLRWLYTYRMQMIADSDQPFPASSLLPEAPFVKHVMQALEIGGSK